MFPLKDTLPRDGLPVVTLALLAVNAVVFLIVQGAGWDGSLSGWAAVPCDLAGRCGVGETGDVVSVVSALFLHAGVVHLAAELLFLWIFAPAVELAIGRAAFLVLYLAGALAGAAVLVALDPGSGVAFVGSAAAISAVLGAHLALHPRARVLWISFVPLFFSLFEVPAAAMLALWAAVVAALAGAGVVSGGAASAGVALAAAAGGLALGSGVVRVAARRSSSVPAAHPAG